MLGLMIGASWGGDKEAARNAQKIWKKLIGIAEPKQADKKSMSAEEIKRKMMCLSK